MAGRAPVPMAAFLPSERGRGKRNACPFLKLQGGWVMVTRGFVPRYKFIGPITIEGEEQNRCWDTSNF